MNGWLADLQSAVRQLTEHKRVSAVAILTFALGLGVNVAMISFANALIRPLPYRDAERLVHLHGASGDDDDLLAVSLPDMLDWRAQARSFERIGIFADWRSLTLTGGGAAERLHANFVDSNYFPVLRATPSAGRFFIAEDDAPGGAQKVVVLAHAFWKRRFGGDSRIVGREILLNDTPFRVIGITRQDFRHFSSENVPDVFVPIAVAEPLFGKRQVERRTARWMWGIGRLQPGVSAEQAAEEMKTIAGRLEKEYPQTNDGISATAEPLRRFLFKKYDKPLRVLLLGAGFVLLIACTNVASLLLVQTASRERDLAVRSAVGATRWATARLLLTESLLLAFIGGAIGLLVGVGTIRLLLSLSSLTFPPFVHVGLDARVLLVSFAAMTAAGVLASILPILRQQRISLREALHQQGRQGGTGGRRQRLSFLIVTQVALATTLLVGAGLMIRSFLALHNENMGFRTERFLTGQTELAGAKYTDDAAKVRMVEQLIEKARSLPGADGAFVWASQPPGNNYRFINLYSEERQDAGPEEQVAGFRSFVSAGALEQVGLRIIRGRGITAADTATSTPVAVMSASAARALWGLESPLGKRFKWRTLDPKIPWVTVVGIAADAKMRGRLDAENLRDVYFAYAQQPAPEAILFVSTKSDPQSLAVPLQRAVQSLDADLPVFDVSALEERVAKEEGDKQLLLRLMILYAVLAVALAAIGIYGVQEYSTRTRRQEIAIRMAIGAERSEIFALVVGEGMRLAIVGVIIGLLASFSLTKIVEAVLYRTSPLDPVAFGLALVLLLAASLIACAVPARRAAAGEVAEALRG